MGKGSLSDKSVIEAAKKMVTFYADGSDRKKPSPAFVLYKIRLVPHMIFTDYKGKKIAELSGQKMILPANIVKKINQVAKKYVHKY